MGRALVADAALPAKALAGKAAATRPCIFCNVCWAEIHVGKPIACIHNPHLGTPGEAAWQPAPAGRKRRIVVVGGGVAGLEAAWVAASRSRRHALGCAAGGRRSIALPGRAEVAGVRVPVRAPSGRRFRIGPPATVPQIVASARRRRARDRVSMRRPATLAADSDAARMHGRSWRVLGRARKRAGTAVLRP
jgi:hypothetical protein